MLVRMKRAVTSEWHKRLHLRKNSSWKQEKKTTRTSPETSERRAESRQNDSEMKLMLFSCDTSMFSTLQHHRIMHKNCVFTCKVYNDSVQQAFPPPSQHAHEENLSNVELKGELSAEAAGQEQKRSVAACRHRWSRRNWWRRPKPDVKLSHDFKFLLPKPEAQWMSPVFPISASGLLDNHGILLDPEKTLQETQHFLERSAGKKWPAFLKTEFDQMKGLLSRPRNRPHDITPHPELISGLMEKNKISVPPDCTTKVLGFKMVNGQKHLILKVIPSSKRAASGPRRSKCVKDQTWLKRDGSTLTAEDQTKALCQSQQNFITSQRPSGCHGDVASRPSPDTGRSAERCHSGIITEKWFQCSDVTDGAEEFVKDSCQISDVLFHSCAHDENTNNTNPRDVQLPEDECECKRRTTLTHLLDTHLTASAASHHHITDAQGKKYTYMLTSLFKNNTLL